MLDAGLTFQGGIDRIGESPEEFHHEFTNRDPYVVATRKAAEAEVRGVDVYTSEELTIMMDAWKNCPLQQCLRSHGMSYYYESVVVEMLWNAFEHGSSWCEAGPVGVRIFFDTIKNIFLLSIEQPLEGFDISKIMNHTRYNVGNVTRGGGLALVKNEESTVGFESVTEGQSKFRTLIFDRIRKKPVWDD
jgi:hypothetical protein